MVDALGVGRHRCQWARSRSECDVWNPGWTGREWV